MIGRSGAPVLPIEADEARERKAERWRRVQEYAQKKIQEREEARARGEKIKSSFEPSATAPPPAAAGNTGTTSSSGKPPAAFDWEQFNRIGDLFGALGMPQIGQTFNVIQKAQAAFSPAQTGQSGSRDENELVRALRELTHEIRALKQPAKAGFDEKGNFTPAGPLGQGAAKMMQGSRQGKGAAGDALSGWVFSALLKAAMV